MPVRATASATYPTPCRNMLNGMAVPWCGIMWAMAWAPKCTNFGRPGRGPTLVKGMTIAVEPMVNAGTWEIKVLPDGWTVKTADGSLSAHYENTILITDGEPEILTFAEDL